MWWIEAVLAGVSGGVAALFAIPARRWGGNGAYVVALLLLFFVLRTGVNLTAKPLLVDWWVISQVEKTFPVYALLLADDPELRRPVLVGMQRYLEDQDIDSPEWQLMQAELTPPLMRQLSRAPSDELVRYAEVFTRILAHLEKTDPEGCFRWMFPEIRGAAIPIGAGDMADLMAATNAAGEAAFQDPHPFEGDLDTLLVQNMDYSAFTEEELIALATPGPETDARTACSAARRIYEQALALPEPDRSQLLRGMFSSVQ